MLAQQIFNGVIIGAIYGLFALGFNLIFGVQKIMNLAHGAVFMAGAFIALYAVQLGLPLWVAFIFSVTLCGVLGVVLDFLAFRPLRKRGEAEFAAIMSSIGANMILMNFARQLSEGQVFRFPFGLVPLTPLQFFGLRVGVIQLIVSGLMVVVVLGLGYYLYRTSFGRQVRAVSSNERAAMLLGIEPRNVYMQTFFLSGVLAGASGILIGLTFNSIHFMMGEPYLLRAFAVLILGGLGSLVGAVVASLILGVAQSLSGAYLPAGFIDIVVFAIIFGMLVVRPNGLFGKAVANSGTARQ